MTTPPSADKRGGAALCCQCGNLRSDGPRLIARDANRSGDGRSDPRGWRMTRTIHCAVCELPTCHAILLSGHLRDNAEEWDYKQARRSGMLLSGVPGDELIDALLKLLDELVKRLGPDEAMSLLTDVLDDFKVSSMDELRGRLDGLRGRLSYRLTPQPSQAGACRPCRTCLGRSHHQEAK